jgi:mono/diheme cytochrome c family protein
MRKQAIIAATIGFTLTAALAISPAAKAEDAKVDFVKDVQPLLAKSCVVCHGADPKGKKPKGKYDLTTKDGAMTSGEHKGKNIVAGKSEESLFYTTLLHAVGKDDDEVGRMPYKKDPLSDAQIKMLKAWIDQGASWPDEVKKIALKE